MQAADSKKEQAQKRLHAIKSKTVNDLLSNPTSFPSDSIEHAIVEVLAAADKSFRSVGPVSPGGRRPASSEGKASSAAYPIPGPRPSSRVSRNSSSSSSSPTATLQATTGSEPDYSTSEETTSELAVIKELLKGRITEELQERIKVYLTKELDRLPLHAAKVGVIVNQSDADKLVKSVNAHFKKAVASIEFVQILLKEPNREGFLEATLTALKTALVAVATSKASKWLLTKGSVGGLIVEIAKFNPVLTILDGIFTAPEIDPDHTADKPPRGPIPFPQPHGIPDLRPSGPVLSPQKPRGEAKEAKYRSPASLPKIVITEECLRTVAGAKAESKVLQELAVTLNNVLPLYEINTPKRIAAFLAQAAFVTGGFVYFVERGNHQYFQKREPGHKSGLTIGNTKEGDGFKYRGRGIFQLTGRWNYEHYTKALKKELPQIDLINAPDQAADVVIGCHIAGKLWQSKQLNNAADQGDIAKVTESFSPKLQHLIERTNHYKHLLEWLETPRLTPQRAPAPTPEPPTSSSTRTERKVEVDDTKPETESEADEPPAATPIPANKLFDVEIPMLYRTQQEVASSNTASWVAINSWRSKLDSFGDMQSVVNKAIDNTLQTIRASSGSNPPAPIEIDLAVIAATCRELATTAVPASQQALFGNYAATILGQHAEQARNLLHQLPGVTNSFTHQLQTWSNHLDTSVQGIQNFDHWRQQLSNAPVTAIGGMSQSASGLLSKVAELPLPAGLKKAIGAAATFTRDAAQAIPVLDGLVNCVLSSSQGVDTALKQVTDLQNKIKDLAPGDLLGKAQLEVSLGKAQATLQIKQTAMEGTLAGVSQGGQLLGSLIGMAGNPQLGQKIAGVVEAGVSIAGTLGQIAAGTLAGGPVGAVIAIGGAVMKLFGSLFGGGGKSDADLMQETIEKLSKHMDQRFDRIEKMLDTMCKHMDQRFDRIEKILEHRFDHIENILKQLHQQMHERFDRIEMLFGTFYKEAMQKFATLHQQMGHLQDTANKIFDKLEKLDTTINRGFQELHRLQYSKVKTRARDLYRISDSKRRLAKAEKYSGVLKEWAAEHSKDELIAGRFTPEAKPKDAELCQEVATHGIFPRINLIASYAKVNFNIPIAGRLINPLAWADAAQAYMYLIEKTPEINFVNIGGERDIADIVQAGEEFNQFIITIKTNGPLFERLLKQYYAAFLDVLHACYKQNLTTIPSEDPAPPQVARSSLEVRIWKNKDPQKVLKQIATLQEGYQLNALLESIRSDQFPPLHKYILLASGMRRKGLGIAMFDEIKRSFPEQRADWRPPHLGLVEAHFRWEGHSQNAALRTAVGEQEPNVRLITALDQLDTAYKLLSLFCAVGFSEEYTRDPVMRVHLERGLWSKESFINYINTYIPDEDQDFVLVAFQKQVVPALEEFSKYLLRKIVHAQEQQKTGELAGHPLVDDVLKKLDIFREMLLPEAARSVNAAALLEEVESDSEEADTADDAKRERKAPDDIKDQTSSSAASFYAQLLAATLQRGSKQALDDAIHQSLHSAAAKPVGNKAGKKNKGKPVKVQSLAEQLDVQIAKYGYECRAMPRDGNCFFHAVSDQLQRQGFSVSEENHHKLRELALDHIVNNWHLYAPLVDGDPATFITRMGTAGEWADEIEMLALSRALNINIVLIRSDGATPTAYLRPSSVSSSTRTVFLGYEVGIHYQSLVPKSNSDKLNQLLSQVAKKQVDEARYLPSKLAKELYDEWSRSTPKSQETKAAFSSSSGASRMTGGRPNFFVAPNTSTPAPRSTPRPTSSSMSRSDIVDRATGSNTMPKS